MLGDSLDFATAQQVENSWFTIKQIPNYAEVAGEILFRKIFDLAPMALNMYSFGPKFTEPGNEEALYQSEVFKRHARGVVNMLDEAVNMMGPDLEPVTKALTELGAKHVEYGVLPAHYGIVGKALLHTLEAALGKEAWTPDVQQGWINVYGFVSTAMLVGADRQIQRRAKRRLAREKKLALKSKRSSRGATSTWTVSPKPPKTSPGSTNARLAEITGIENLQEKTGGKQNNFLGMIADALSLSNRTHGDARSVSTTSVDTSETELLIEISYSCIVENVYISWDQVRKIPNYEEVAGVLLFRKIFEIAPEAKGLFNFAKGFEDDKEGLYSSPDFLVHAKRVVSMLDVAVNMLGPDLEPVTFALEELGERHAKYGVLPAHYPVVGEALLSTLELALGEAWTLTVEEGWTSIYTFVSTTMMKGAERE